MAEPPFALGGTWAVRPPIDRVNQTIGKDLEDCSSLCDGAAPPPPPLIVEAPPVETALKKLVERPRPKRLERHQVKTKQRSAADAPPPPLMRRFLVINNSEIISNTSVQQKFAKNRTLTVRTQRWQTEPRIKVTRHFARPSPIYQNQRYPSTCLRYGTETSDKFGWPKGGTFQC